MPTSLILASASPARKALLVRLQRPFKCIPATIDESQKPNENIEEYVTRLAKTKAKTVAKQFPDQIVIGCDQAAYNGHKIIGKPYTHKNAVEQLLNFQGKTITFYTALYVTHLTKGLFYQSLDTYDVIFRTLTKQEIENYLLRETPYQCAGSFKSEGLGICLFSQMSGNDPTSLIGLPLISLNKALIALNTNPLL